MEKFYVFLDVDGVLNADPMGLYDKVEQKNVKVLNNFLLQLGEHHFNPIIVISSAWRLDFKKFENLKTIFSELKLNYHDQYLVTKVGLNPARGMQIGAFLNVHNVDYNFVIIDDYLEDISRFFPKHHILCPSGDGLNQKDVDLFFKDNFNKILKENENLNEENEKQMLIK